MLDFPTQGIEIRIEALDAKTKRVIHGIAADSAILLDKSLSDQQVIEIMGPAWLALRKLLNA